MYKSALTFGLLASSLVMLSAMPIFNNNNNSFLSNTVALAQEYDKYGASSYSTYPTDDKKYECRTGPFEGFFVSSVEFCKFKFDDKDRKDVRDNRTGTQGPPGPAGPPGANGTQGPPGSTGATGATGATGPSGITQLNATNIYKIKGPTNTYTNSTPSNATSIAQCHTGDVLLNGGFIASGRDYHVSFAVPTDDISGNLPTGFIGSLFGTEAQVTSYAYCFNNSP